MEDIGGLQEYLDGLPAMERAIRHQGFVLLINGKMVSASLLADSLNCPETEIRQTITTMEKRGTLIWDHDRDVLTATGGLSLTPTDHCLKFNGRNMYAWCAADAVGIPAALSLDAEIHSACYHCSDPVHIQMKKGRIHRSSPDAPQVFVTHADPALSVSGDT